MKEARKILVVDDEENVRHMLSVLLSDAGYEVETAENGLEALKKLEAGIFDFVLADIRMPKLDGMGLLHEMQRRKLFSTVIMMSAYGTGETAIETMKMGAYDYIPKPFNSDEVILTLRKAEERERLIKENKILRRQVYKDYGFHNIITRNPKLEEILRTITKIADYKTTVLITGESGTGKELIAKAIHYSSVRKEGPFIPVNCGAIPETLLESELFGHIKGAFTDASSSKKGLFEEANEGTLFLDEIGELPQMLQVKLLRVLQEDEIRRVGDTKPIPIDVRVIAATGKNLAEEVKAGRFRSDLFYRLNVLSLHLPPLRERKEDIPLLVSAFIERYNQKFNKSIKGVSKEVMNIFLEYNWEGNVRELENTIERAMALAEGEKIEVDDLPSYLRGKFESKERKVFIPEDEISIKKIMREVEKELIQRALKQTKGNRTQASKLLEISSRALIYKIKKYELDK